MTRAARGRPWSVSLCGFVRRLARTPRRYKSSLAGNRRRSRTRSTRSCSSPAPPCSIRTARTGSCLRHTRTRTCRDSSAGLTRRTRTARSAVPAAWGRSERPAGTHTFPCRADSRTSSTRSQTDTGSCSACTAPLGSAGSNEREPARHRRSADHLERLAAGGRSRERPRELVEAIAAHVSSFLPSPHTR